MQTCFGPRAGLLFLFAWFALAVSSTAQTESTLHIFTGYSSDGAVGSNASNTYGGLIADQAGNLYGTTAFGGTSQFCYQADTYVGCGTVFEELPPQVKGGAWTENVLYSFDPNYVGDGYGPTGGLAMDAAGNLYGTTVSGQGSDEPGIIYELSPPSQTGNPWTETILHVGGGNGSLVFDGSGNLYGTTNEGGKYNVGTVYELSPPSQAGGSWTYSTLYNFGKDRLDGSYPEAGLIFDSKGNLYGTTNMGGIEGHSGFGTVFQLVRPSGSGEPWTENVVYRFSDGADGGFPSGGLLFFKGVLYGTTQGGGSFDNGTIFQIALVDKKVVETVLYSFDRDGSGGSDPRAALVADSAGNLYSTADVAGSFNAGTVFKLAPPSSPGGTWTYSVLYNFTGGTDGAYPAAPLLLENGALYGLTSQGGDENCFANVDYGCGTVFQITP